MVAALVCASLAARAAAMVPARADAALLLDGAEAALGLQPLLRATGKRSPALSDEQAAAWLLRSVGVDLLSGGADWGLAPSGPRALVFAPGGIALAAPVRDAGAARKRLLAWLNGAGAPHPIKPRGALASGSGKSQRAGLIFSAGGASRLLTASGVEAASLIAALAQTTARKATPSLAQDTALAPLLAASTGRAALLVRMAEPLQGAVLDVDASPSGLVAGGLVGSKEPLLAGAAPDAAACGDAALLCVRAGLGAAGRTLVALVARAYAGSVLRGADASALASAAARVAGSAERVALRVDGIDVRLLGDPQYLWTVRFRATVAGEGAGSAPSLDFHGPRSLCTRSAGNVAQLSTPCAPAPADVPAGQGPALEAQLDTAGLDAAFARLSPLDALRGPAAATALALRLMVGGLLRGSGPITATGEPHELGARVELRWPLR